MTGYEPVIGLEVHCQLDLATKLFSSAPVDFGGEPNSRVSPVDMGLPGVLPTLNENALRVAIRAGLALEGSIRRHTKFDRKNYFYPDLPKGYQISQYDQPFCEGGRVPLGDGRYGGLVRIHLEEDAGKSTHTDRGSLVDLNRVGVALIEIVGHPDLRSPEDAHAFLDNLKQILQYAGVSDCDMEKGSLRCDANISVRPIGQHELGTKVEIKNLNSFKMVERSLHYEIRRQSAVLAAGGTIHQETRLWNEERGETSSMRSKESAPDYRYFPEPDLPPIHVSKEMVVEIKNDLPEMPLARRARLEQEHGLPAHDLKVLLADRHVADYFEQVAEASGDAKAASNWTMTEVLRVLNDTGTTVAALPVTPEAVAGIIEAISAGKINHPAAKKVFNHLVEHGGTTADAIAQLGLEQIQDRSQLEPIVRQVVADHPTPVADYKAGKTKALHSLKGMVMKETRGKASPTMVDEILVELLAE